MKISTMAVLCAVACALAATGCKYNKAGKGGAGSGLDANGRDISGLNGDAMSISDATGGRFEDMYTKCTDVSFTPVYFGFDSSVVPQGELPKIDEVARHLTEKTDRVVVVEGHCDERGSAEYNLSLGQNRAEIIRNYLVQNGIAGDRIQCRSYGSEKPAATGHDESSWSQNRRGEFGIYQK